MVNAFMQILPASLGRGIMWISAEEFIPGPAVSFTMAATVASTLSCAQRCFYFWEGALESLLRLSLRRTTASTQAFRLGGLHPVYAMENDFCVVVLICSGFYTVFVLCSGFYTAFPLLSAMASTQSLCSLIVSTRSSVLSNGFQTFIVHSNGYYTGFVLITGNAREARNVK